MYIYFVFYDNLGIDLSLNFIICWTNQYLKYLFIIATGRYPFFSFLLTSHAWTPVVTERKKFPPAVVSNPDQPSAETSMLPTWQPRDDRGRDATVTNNDWLADYLHDNANFKNKKKKKNNRTLLSVSEVSISSESNHRPSDLKDSTYATLCYDEG